MVFRWCLLLVPSKGSGFHLSLLILLDGGC